jgi:hypothetical protein
MSKAQHYELAEKIHAASVARCNRMLAMLDGQQQAEAIRASVAAQLALDAFMESLVHRHA